MKRALLVSLLALASTAHADDEATKPSYRAVVDRVDLEPASVTGYRLRVYLSALAIEGQLLDLTDPKSIRLYLGASEKKAPFALGTYDATNGDLAIVVVVQATVDFSDALPMISEALDRELLATLTDRAQVAVMTYGETTGTGKLASPKAVRGKLTLATDGSAGEPALLDTLDRAMRLLRKVTTASGEESESRPIRKMIVVIGDGRDRSGDKERVTRFATRAAKEGVRIHALAYSPNDVRRPLLFLGELSKKSFGTFRWPGRGHHPTPESWSDTFKQLRDEISKQYVLTYFVTAEDDVVGKKLHVVTVGRTEATSNDIKVPPPTCAGAACETGYCADDHCLQPAAPDGRGVVGWLVLVGGIGVGAILVLGLVGFVMSRQRVAPPAPVPGMPGMHPPVAKPKKGKPGPPPPGMLPNGRPIPALLIMSGPRSGERLLLKNGFLVGKQPGSDLHIEDGYTSSHHAQITMDPAGNCKLYDQGSTNGTFVNGVRITESALEHGAMVRVGATELRFLAQ